VVLKFSTWFRSIEIYVEFVHNLCKPKLHMQIHGIVNSDIWYCGHSRKLASALLCLFMPFFTIGFDIPMENWASSGLSNCYTDLLVELWWNHYKAYNSNVKHSSKVLAAPSGFHQLCSSEIFVEKYFDFDMAGACGYSQQGWRSNLIGRWSENVGVGVGVFLTVFV